MMKSPLVLAVLSLLSLSALCPAAAPRPNIVLIFIDDMGYGDIGPFGSTKNRTPALDRMASEGMRLTSFYAAPVCTPSRAQVLTGCYAKRVSLPNVIFPACPTGLNPQENTVAELLKQQGYATMCIGKWHVGDQPEFLPTRHGFDRYFGIPYSNDMGGARGSNRPPLPLVRDEQVIETLAPVDQDRITERYTEEAVKFIRERRDGPFFLYFPHTAVHVPLHPGAKFQGKSGNGTYGDWVEEVDWSVGQLLGALREAKLADSTLVIFTSDNGPWLTQGKNGGIAGPLRGGKGGTFEGGVRVPTIAWWPGQVPAGSACDAYAGNIDFLPTFTALAGGAVPAGRKIDGKDITPLLLGKSKQSPHEAWFYIAGNTIQAVRSGPWKLAVKRQSAGMGKAAAEPGPFKPTLYNLETDIGEKNDLAAQNPDIVQRLEALIAKSDLADGGDGVRPPGRVEKPVGLYLPGQAPPPEAQASAGKPVGELKIGECLAGADAPAVEGKPITISCDVEPKAPSGVIVAHGGAVVGYAVYLKEGKVVFTVRQNKVPVSIASPEAPAGKFRLEAKLAKDGAMTLSVDGRQVAAGKAPGPLPNKPAEDFCVGGDNREPVGEYPRATRFKGEIANLKIATE